ncbi:MAG: phage terminase large subunit family protein, partial [Selenomonadaceae bacterium]|nr:phage terminase large subunit family protein [Selenomonadaceae bacterium]
MPIFSLLRKQERLSAKEGRRESETKRRRIISIRPVQSRPVKCIAVDSASHLFLAGKAMIPTHNSDIMNNVIGRFAHLDPAPIMMIQPTIEMAQDYSKSRISPMIRDTKSLSNLFYSVREQDGAGSAKTRDGNNTILSKIFPGGRLFMAGSNSPAGLASRVVRVLLADEVDRFAASAGSEGDPVDLASKRMTTFWNHVSGLFSTPTIEGASRIETEYLAGTQEEWRHQCPNCGEFHVLRHTDMDCPDMVESRDKDGNRTYVIRDVLWRCPDCGYKFSERQMKDAPQKYVMQNPVAMENGIRSFFVNGFSSPWLTWTGIMKEWHEARGDPQREKVVVNTRFGETYRLIGAFDDETQFLRRRERYDADLPKGVLALTAAVDVQGNRLEYEICGWGFGEECWGIQKGIIPGNPDHPKVWQLLDGILDRPYCFADGSSLKIIRTYIDTGGLSTQSVYEYCKKNLYKQRIGIKGYAGKPGIPLLYKISRDRKGYNLPIQFLGVNDGKQQVMTRLGLEKPGPQ